ncbi:MAG: response regulator, partial [Candidatus Binatia bacterium]
MSRLRPTVMVVDDDPASRDGLASLLERWGYKSQTAVNGKAALKTCEESQPDAMVLDLIMPEMTGLELVQALGERVHQMAVIMLTGQAT